MKLSNETLTVLKNFASINPGLEFKKGNKLATISPTKTILAKATIAEEFTEDFCIYDLNQFLAVYSLNKDIDLDFDVENVLMKSPKKKTAYKKAQKTTIVTVPEKELSLPSVDASFTFLEDDIADVLKAAAVLQSPHISFESDGNKIYVKTFDAKDDSAHTTSTEVSEGNSIKFKVVLTTEYFKFIPGTYEVKISSQGLASFKNTNFDMQYWIAIESNFSKFGE